MSSSDSLDSSVWETLGNIFLSYNGIWNNVAILGKHVKNLKRKLDHLYAEEQRLCRPRSSRIPALEGIPEIKEQQIEIPVPQRPTTDVTRRATEEAVNISDLNLTTAGRNVTTGVVNVSKHPLDVTGEVPNVEPQAPTKDIADLPTQKLETLSQVAAQIENPPKRHKSEGHKSKRRISFGGSQRAAYTPYAPNRENFPSNITSPQLPPLQQSQADATRMLKEAGFSGIHAIETIQPVEQAVMRKERSEGLKTSLESLKRSEESVADSVNMTDPQRFIRREWGIKGTMLKIMKSVQLGAGPITVSALLAHGPLWPAHRRIIAARCFTSILKLKQHGFIKIVKDPETLEILDISLGRMFDSP